MNCVNFFVFSLEDGERAKSRNSFITLGLLTIYNNDGYDKTSILQDNLLFLMVFAKINDICVIDDYD